MKKRLTYILAKKAKVISMFRPKDIRLSFYIYPLGDISSKSAFTAQDLDNIAKLEVLDDVNQGLIERGVMLEDGDIPALLGEGVLADEPTGADLAIYDYPVVVENQKVKFDYTNYINGQSRPIDSEDIGINYFDNDSDNDYFVRNCMLAEENPLGGEASKVVHTFNGYLEVTRGDFSIIRNCDYDKIDIAGVYMPQEYVYKYRLRQGDKIMCTCKEDNNKMLIDALFTINQIPRRSWDAERPWLNRLTAVKPQAVKGKGEYIKVISNKFDLLDGDNVFVYLTKTSQKNKVLTKFVKELDEVFDNVIYINPNYKPFALDIEGYNIIKFTTPFSYRFNNKVTNVLLAAQHAKRLIEMGKRVAILIDDIDAISALDKKYDRDSAIIKTIFDAVKVSSEGKCTSFTFASLRSNDIKSLDMPMICKDLETLGIVFDNNEIDLFNSYRI